MKNKEIKISHFFSHLSTKLYIILKPKVDSSEILLLDDEELII